jgi:hypothetical protein
MNRRDFLKTIGAGLLAAAAPEIVVASTRTIIDLNPQALPVEPAYAIGYDPVGDGFMWVGELRHFDLYLPNRVMDQSIADLEFVRPGWMLEPKRLKDGSIFHYTRNDDPFAARGEVAEKWSLPLYGYDAEGNQWLNLAKPRPTGRKR